MIVKRIAAHLLEHSQKGQKRFFRRIDLIFWLVVLGLSSAVMLTQPTPSALAATTTTSQKAVAHRPATPANPVAPRDTCDQQGNCYPDGTTYVTGSAPSAGNIKNPVADDALLFFTRPDLTVGQRGVQLLWAGGVAIVDVFIVLLVSLHAVRIMTSGSMFSYADVAESIPRILVGVIAAHISLALIGILLGLNNGLCSAFLGWANTTGIHATNLPDNGNLSFKGIFADAFSGMTGWKNLVLDIIPGVGQFNIIASLMEQLPRMILQLVALTMSIMLFAQLIIRLLLIDLFTVISAPCLACWGLPGRSGQPVTSFWLQGAIGAILSQVLQTVGVIVSQFIFDNIFNIVQQHSPGFFTSTNDMINGPDLIKLVVYIAMLWFILRLPALFRLNPAGQMIVAGGQVAGGAVQGAVGAATTAVTATVGAGTAIVMLAK
jgi:hypothetical protein